MHQCSLFLAGVQGESLTLRRKLLTMVFLSYLFWPSPGIRQISFFPYRGESLLYQCLKPDEDKMLEIAAGTAPSRGSIRTLSFQDVSPGTPQAHHNAIDHTASIAKLGEHCLCSPSAAAKAL